MWIKPLIAILFLLLLLSLGRAFYFLVRDQGTSNRTLDSLALRVALATLFIGVVAYGILTGELRSKAPGNHPNQGEATAEASASENVNK